MTQKILIVLIDRIFPIVGIMCAIAILIHRILD